MKKKGKFIFEGKSHRYEYFLENFTFAPLNEVQFVRAFEDAKRIEWVGWGRSETGKHIPAVEEDKVARLARRARRISRTTVLSTTTKSSATTSPTNSKDPWDLFAPSFVRLSSAIEASTT